MMSEHDFGASPEPMILDSHTTANSLTVVQNPMWICRHERKQKLPQNGLSQSSFSLE
jgi:hypothetical protein